MLTFSLNIVSYDTEHTHLRSMVMYDDFAAYDNVFIISNNT